MTLSAILFTVSAMIVAAFQLALVAGAPWGTAAMGGRYPGVLPPKARALSLIQALIMLLFILIVLTRAELILHDFYHLSVTLIWFVTGLLALSLLGNLATPSKIERNIWSPVALVLLATAVVTATR
ncbi:hypothetical protein [Reinekea blandensis]|uniref:Uncharacterized protein n=1 Tax=Reinekea blandensis MED297 TaxID=314283 RepID=A4BH09_9GAMM|nr:hypothetical protein [Reinekea blandensis]EAR08655.1 hypothetical protein MED297_03085 [Reinekea sp. MED297] [Reinekea blandensis MED297]